MTWEQYKFPLLMLAGLSLMGGLAWWFLGTELPPPEAVEPKRSAAPVGLTSPAPAVANSETNRGRPDLKSLNLEALLNLALQEGREREERQAILAEITGRRTQAGALDHLLVEERDPLRPFTVELLKTWSRADRDAALTWWRGVKLGTGKDLLTKPLVEGWLKSAGAEGIGFYFTLEAGERLAMGKALAWAVKDTEGINGLDGLFSFQDPDWTKEALVARRDLLRRATDAMRAREGPEAAAAWLAKYAGAPFAYGAAFDTLVSDWAQKDAPAAAAWAVELPSNTHLWDQPLGLPRAVKEWATRDIAAASRWANAQSGHRNYDLIAEGIAEVVAGEDMKAAGAWVESIRNLKRKQEVRKRLGIPGK
jgi:hypothetical protein